MSHGKFMEKLNKADKLLRQFPHGTRAADFAKRLGVKRTQVYDYLNGLVLREKAYNKYGLWFPQEVEPQPQFTERFFWKRQVREQLNRLLNRIMNNDPDDLCRVAKATLLFLKCGDLPSEIREKLQLDIKALEDKIVWAENAKGADFVVAYYAREKRLQLIAKRVVPEILEKVSILIQT